MEQVSKLEHTSKSGALINLRKTRLSSIIPDRHDYDPRDHRAPPHEIKPWMAYFNLLRLSCGVGMLGMPLATSQMGIVLGPIITLLTGILIIGTHRMLNNYSHLYDSQSARIMHCDGYFYNRLLTRCNCLSLGGMILIFYHIIFDYNGEIVSAETNVAGVLFGFGILLYNLSAVGVVLSIDKSLVNTRKMTTRFGVLNVGIMCPTILAVVFGAYGYYSFGTMEENILRSLPYDETTSMAAVFLYLLSVALAYPLQSYPAIMTIVEVIKYQDDTLTPSDKALKYIERIGRALFVTLSFVLCYIAPFQGPLVAFVGNLCTTMLQLVFPALMDLCLRYPHDYGPENIYLFKDILIISLGLICFAAGVYSCGYLIHLRILSSKSPTNGGFT